MRPDRYALIWMAWRMNRPMNSQHVLDKLNTIVGSSNVLWSREDIYPYSMDAFIPHPQYGIMPAFVIRPHTTDEVARVLAFANKEKIPIVPRGAGTNLVGAVLPTENGIVLDLTGMNKILSINRSDLACVVETGVVHNDLENELGRFGLFWPPDPGSTDACTLGGVLSMNAGGMRALKYGTARDWVLGLKAVLPTGEVIKTGASTLKGNVGYDLTRLIVGSEGTLCVITEASLKVRPIPESTARVAVFFDEIDAAGAVVSKIFESGLTPVIVELVDRNIIRAVNSWLNRGFQEAEAYMLVDVDGTRAEVERTAKKVELLLREAGARDVRCATSKDEMAELWLIRSEGGTALPRVTGKMNITHDFCVPLSKVPEAFRRIRELAEKRNIHVAIIAHAGDGNIHPLFSADLNDPEEMRRAKKLNEEICSMALSLGGTISGEHGVGLDKADLMRMECGEASLRLMREIKRVFDPNHIMNPGKMGL